MKTMTIKQFTKKAQAILKANNAVPNCMLVQVSHFTHSNGHESFTFSINGDSIFSGKSPEECLAKLEASFIPNFETDMII